MTETPKPESGLLPCPFCGGMAGIVLQKTGLDTGYWFIDCCGREDDEGAECPADMRANSRDQVISYWNRRATLASDTDAIRKVRDEMALWNRYRIPGPTNDRFNHWLAALDEILARRK